MAIVIPVSNGGKITRLIGLPSFHILLIEPLLLIQYALPISSLVDPSERECPNDCKQD